MQGYKQRKAYIATQGPLSGTVSDLWRMVWENHCSCIVMLCETSEKGQVRPLPLSLKLSLTLVCVLQESSHCFWPEGSEEKMYGKLRVVGKRESVHGDITERRIEVGDVEGHGGTQRVVTLLQLNSWPLRELPHPTAILSLVELLSKAQRSSPSRHTVVMCRYIHTLSVSLSLCHLSLSLSLIQ